MGVPLFFVFMESIDAIDMIDLIGDRGTGYQLDFGIILLGVK